MDLEESNNMPNIKSKDKDTISLGFLTFEEKLICLNEYTFNKNLKEVIDDFIKKNNEFTLKPYFNFGNNFNIYNLNFYAKKDEELKKLQLNKNIMPSLNIEDLEDTVNFLGLNYCGSSSTCAKTNLDFLKIYVNYENRFQYLEDNFEEYIIKNTHLIGKPQLNRTRFFLFNKLLKEVKIISCNSDDIKKYKINNFSFLDNYCNAINNLYIYEGISSEGNHFSKFFNINLEKNKITLISPKFPKRFLHSMIFIPSSYIFIIGGKSTKEILTYEIDDKNTSYDIYPHQLPKELLEPSLISINNKFIYILENSTISFNIFRLNIPDISPIEQIEIKNKNSINVDQKFFGVVRNKNSILFLGGQKLKMNMDNNNQEKKYCFEYHYDTDKIVLSKREFSPTEFIEKTFIPLGEEVYVQFAEFKNNNNKGQLKMVQFDGKEQEMEKSLSNN